MTSTVQLVEQPLAEHRPDSADTRTVRIRPPALSRATLRTVLGFIWLLDGALQLQSFMFTKGFATGIIAPSASGQPSFVAGPVEWNARVIGAHPVLLNGLFASVQLALGLGFLFRRSARIAIAGSVLWAAGVWYLGEGLGGLGSGTTALLGAPGAALLYIILALAAWPGPPQRSSRRDPDGGQRPPSWILRVWTILWVGFAVLSILPSNSSARSISRGLTTNASMVPAWLAAVDRWLASAVHTADSGAVVIAVSVELAVGLLVIGGGALRTVALWAGMGVAVVYWAAGQSFGQLFSGQATDPSTGPLLVIVGLTALGAAGQFAQSGARSTPGRRPGSGSPPRLLSRTTRAR